MTRAAHEAPVDEVLARVYREEHTRLLAILVRRFGELDLAEDVAQEAMAAALATWPTSGVPDSPLAWLVTTAKRKALDVVRRDAEYAKRLARLHIEAGDPVSPAADGTALHGDDLPDERLAMLFGSCHPAIAPADRIALMLRFVGGLSTAEVAQSLLLPVPTLQARITRAKKRIRTSGIPLRVPADPEERTRRLPLVLAAIHLVFTEGYAATSGDVPLRAELTTEAIRLARILQRLLPGAAEPEGMLALFLLTEARSAARIDAHGVPIALEHQDRSRWSRARMAEGSRLAEAAAGRPDAGRYTIQAAIAAVHCEAPTFGATDWAQIVVLYDLLLTRDPGPVTRMNRAIAIGRRDGFARGLELLDALADEPELQRHHPFHLARALTLEELGRASDAHEAYGRALGMAGNRAEQLYIERRRAGCLGDTQHGGR